MRKNLRRQDDNMGDAYTTLTGLTCTGKDMARQEGKDEADINILLKKFGVGVPQKAQPVFGVTDYTIDLQTGIEAARQATAAWANVPRNIRHTYRNWQNVITAIDRGDLKVADLNPPPKAEEPATEPPKAEPPKTA